ncbi:MAG TPA: cysteine dioxygenase family protein [Burkholderiales bacterium]|nr:cysteine dioxygenase family protein [Burkholderiales bacterium]
MTRDTYALSTFVEDLRAIARTAKGEAETLSRLRPLVLRAALSRQWLLPRHYEALPEQGNGVHLLHEEPDHTLAVAAVCWLPGRETPPHNHGTWAVVAGVEGPERNIFWKRIDDGTRPGYAQLERIGEKVVGVGDVLAMPAATIHSIANDTDHVTLTLHVYGTHLNFSPRFQFDVERHSVSPRRTVWREG